jgi:hypothetical protein
MKTKKAVSKKRKSPPPEPFVKSPAREPVVDVVAIEPDTVAIHVRTEPEHIAEILPHAEDPKTFFQKLADWFNDK